MKGFARDCHGDLVVDCGHLVASIVPWVDGTAIEVSGSIAIDSDTDIDAANVALLRSAQALVKAMPPESKGLAWDDCGGPSDDGIGKCTCEEGYEIQYRPGEFFLFISRAWNAFQFSTLDRAKSAAQEHSDLLDRWIEDAAEEANK